MLAGSALVLLLALVSCAAPPSPSPTSPSRAAYIEWAQETIDAAAGLLLTAHEMSWYGNVLDQMTAFRRALSGLDDLAEEARSISPPNEMRSVHADIVRGLNVCTEALYEHLDGNHDASDLLLAVCVSTLMDVQRSIGG